MFCSLIHVYLLLTFKNVWPARTNTDIAHTLKISTCLCIILAVSLKVRKNVTQVLNLDRGIFLVSGAIFLLMFLEHLHGLLFETISSFIKYNVY